MSEPCFVPARILLPDPSVPLARWACLACDQFTSQPDYWADARAAAGEGPTALDLVLPEVYLEQPDVEGRIAAIHTAMERYEQQVLTRAVNGYVYLERVDSAGNLRAGLVGAVDLEQYSYAPGTRPAVRPTEGTVVSRIPPRLRVRQGAALESPHVMMLIDDPADTVLGPLGRAAAGQAPLYEGQLMLGGGSIRGWAVEDPARVAAITQALAALGAQANFDARYPAAAGQPPLTLAVGDGNHSLATAKAWWEQLKPTLSPEEQKTHPARWCLAEVCNIHSPAIGIEPIHRVVFGADPAVFAADFAAWLKEKNALADPAAPGAQRFRLTGGETLAASEAVHPLAVGTLEAFLADWLPAHPAASVDFIHGEDAVAALCADGTAAGMLLPPFAKEDIFRGVVLGGVLPRKTFSMGHARDKRYYLECRRILP